MNKALNTIMKAISLAFLLLFYSELIGQCFPEQSENCDTARILCSLEELNGYACNNYSLIPSHCNTLCSNGGVGHNTSWWAFRTGGGLIQITLSIGGCSTNQGLQFGIWGDCQCKEDVACVSIPCIPPGSVTNLSAHLIPCKRYYLWIDGCTGDICDFTFDIVGATAPALSPLSKINEIESMIIDQVCEGACDMPFFVKPQPDGCEPDYIWTLDNNRVGVNSNQILLDFPDAGSFVLCVTAYLGDYRLGSICSFEGPKCATVKVGPLQDTFYGSLRNLCYVQTLPNGFEWHSQRIFNSGIYVEHLDVNCCKFDSIVEFFILDMPKTPKQVFHISCDNESYIDIIGRAHPPCKDQ